MNNAISTGVRDQRVPTITTDGAGGAIITWQDEGNGSNYVQRIDAAGVIRWTPGGVQVSNASGNQGTASITSDGAGGAYLTWADGRNGINNFDIYAQHFDSKGSIHPGLWIANGIAIATAPNDLQTPTITSDGIGGALIAWNSPSLGIYAQRINAAGMVHWASTVTGVQASSAGGIPGIVSDSAGGAIIVWAGFGLAIRAQRINGAGVVQWAPTATGVPVATSLLNANQVFPAITTDGAGGAIVTWAEDNTTPEQIYAQRINAGGVVKWGANGIAMTTAETIAQFEPTIVSDGAGGAIIAWHEDRGITATDDVFAQRVDGNGAIQWTDNGAAISTSPNGAQWHTSLVSDGAGGAIITWEDNRNNLQGFFDIYAQRINAAGVVQWTIDGVAISTAANDQLLNPNGVRPTYRPNIVSNSAGCAVITWYDGRNGVDFDIYAQQVNGSGSLGLPCTSLMISRFRENGPAGPRDEFIEIFNATGEPHTVVSSSGYGVYASAGNGTTSTAVSLVCLIPSGTVIPARGYFLCAGANYSLGDLGRNGGLPGATAVGDAAIIADIPDDAGLAFINISDFLLFDSVGFAQYGAGSPAPASPFIRPFFCEGTCLQPIGDASIITLVQGGFCPTSVGPTCAANAFPVVSGGTIPSGGVGATPICYGESGQYEFLRRQTKFDPIVGTLHQDTNNNAADFILVSPNSATSNIGQTVTGVPGVTSVLGSAGPHSLSAPPDLPGISLTKGLFDDCQGPVDLRNFERSYTVTNSCQDPLGTFTVRLRYTNNSSADISRLRFRVDDLSTLCGTQAPLITATGEAKNLLFLPTCQGGGSDVGVFTAILKVLNSFSHTVIDCHSTAQTVNGTVIEDLSITGSTLAGPGSLSPLGGGVDTSLIINPSFNSATLGDGVTGGTGVFATVVGTTPTTKVLFIKVRFGVVQSGRFKVLITPEGK